MSELKHQDAITKATLLFDNGYSASYVYDKLLKEGFGEEEAKSILESLTDKPFAKAAASSSASSASAATVEAPENTGSRRTQFFVLFGILLMLIGFGLSLWLPSEWRVAAYVLLIAGPVLMLIGAFQSSS